MFSRLWVETDKKIEVVLIFFSLFFFTLSSTFSVPKKMWINYECFLLKNDWILGITVLWGIFCRSFQALVILSNFSEMFDKKNNLKKFWQDQKNQSKIGQKWGISFGRLSSHLSLKNIKKSHKCWFIRFFWNGGSYFDYLLNKWWPKMLWLEVYD